MKSNVKTSAELPRRMIVAGGGLSAWRVRVLPRGLRPETTYYTMHIKIARVVGLSDVAVRSRHGKARHRRLRRNGGSLNTLSAFLNMKSVSTSSLNPSFSTSLTQRSQVNIGKFVPNKTFFFPYVFIK